MKVSFMMKTIIAAGLIVSLLLSPLSGVVLLRGTSGPKKQVKKNEHYPTLDIAHNESDRLKINGWRMSPSDVEKIRREGRELKVTCKYFDRI